MDHVIYIAPGSANEPTQTTYREPERGPDGRLLYFTGDGEPRCAATTVRGVVLRCHLAVGHPLPHVTDNAHTFRTGE